ncbi:subtilisin inhibitor CLSI-I-like protein [Cinnamomum micranthum f. kanehirae]|uniref:Subtilisin inhibitor CLSI-I-like protein n=1 Tax=Cinnamomum micranthum f. kanehirae TaxID=337451 RepID=A0A3S3PZX3_9MAGN|nr:subtilisin inhibitor CLSI-I-like protein [Cinnamomum micranthum f. kanehirae]
MPTYPSLKSMKFYATFPLSLLLCFLIFSLVMAEEDQRKEIPQEQSLPSIEQQNLVSDGVDATIDKNSLGLNLPAARRQWPDVVGMSVEEAEKRIKEDMPMAIFHVILPDCSVTMDYNLRRVRLYVDSSGKVVRPPKTG